MAHNIQSKVTLTVTEGPGKSFVFSEPDNFLLGRDNEGTKAHCRLSPDDTYVFRNHFLIEINPPDCFMHDAGSLNGTFIIRKNEKAVCFLQGRKEREWEQKAQSFAKRYTCITCTKAEDKVQISNDDSIAVGDTLIAVAIQEEAGKKDARQFEGLFNCIRCGKGMDADNFAKDARELASMDFICTDCRNNARKKQAPQLTAACYGCGKEVSS
ncbi:MAG: FHA domain-containing protein, partial [Pseudomonadota bacterium]